jgi:uncharacterized protein (TIGR02284 family)
MNNINFAIKEIQHLIVANYERMVAFEQAAFNARTPSLQQYFESGAAESEMNITELNEILASVGGEPFDVEMASRQNLLGTSHLFTGQKNINTLLKHVQYLEKAVIKWYKAGMKNLKGFSQSMTQVLSKQYTVLEASHVYVQSC